MLQKVYLRLTLKEWRDRCHAERRLAMASKWCKNLVGEFEALSAPGVTPKTASSARFAAYMCVFDATRHGILREKMKKRWGNAAFRSWRAGKVCLSGFVGKAFTGTLEHGTYRMTGVHLAYGDAKFSSTFKGTHTAPTTALFKAIVAASHVDTRAGHGVGPQTEWGSSADCGGCGEVLSHVRTTTLAPRMQAKVTEWEAAGKGEAPWWMLCPEIRGLHYCNNITCPNPEARVKDRDPQASDNIMQVHVALMLGGPIPANLDQSLGAPRRVYPPPVYL